MIAEKIEKSKRTTGSRSGSTAPESDTLDQIAESGRFAHARSLKYDGDHPPTPVVGALIGSVGVQT